MGERARSATVAVIAVLAWTYLGAAFIAWEWNPGHWDEAARIATVLIGSMLAVVAGAASAAAA